MPEVAICNLHVEMELASVVQSTWNPGILSRLICWSRRDKGENAGCREC